MSMEQYKVSAVDIGATYKLRHSRFGNAKVKVVKVSGEWIDVEIISGTLRGACDFWTAGDVKTVRESHCTFTKLSGAAQ
jgi:hypothetical protein